MDNSGIANQASTILSSVLELTSFFSVMFYIAGTILLIAGIAKLHRSASGFDDSSVGGSVGHIFIGVFLVMAGSFSNLSMSVNDEYSEIAEIAEIDAEHNLPSFLNSDSQVEIVEPAENKIPLSVAQIENIVAEKGYVIRDYSPEDEYIGVVDESGEFKYILKTDLGIN